ncbi:MAG: [Fe-Fe] hydrogenase large subunit C-terminal domain-containing protein [Candidatus ainarchaeum sp.]|nr:[Fe-Fe] hydrogenase large subunit C-terminal domain-containing protein [Candidatus ainarchaeum sp.]
MEKTIEQQIYFDDLDGLIKAMTAETKKGKILVAQIAPAVRFSIGECFGEKAGIDNTKKTISLLKELGFDYVFDTPLGADLIVVDGVKNFLKMDLKHFEKFPVFTSCCIGWRRFAQKNYFYKKHLSKEVSPNMALGLTAKTFFANKIKKKAEQIVVVGIMPCTLKKYETLYEFKKGIKYVDYVVTTKELGAWAKKENIDFKTLKGHEFDYLHESSKEGLMFGASGGVTEAFLTALADKLGEKKEILFFRNNKRIKRQKVKIGDLELNVASVYGFGALVKLHREMDRGVTYHFVEVMQCPLGCVGGPGQPEAGFFKIKRRAKELRRHASRKREHSALENKTVDEISAYLEKKKISLHLHEHKEHK